jgi:HD superfamily phosphodiesterase
VLIAEKAHDDGHAAHSLSVMTLALLLGKQAGLPEAALHALGIGALLHDLGKQGSIHRSCATTNATGTRRRSTRRIAAAASTRRRAPAASRNRCSTPSCTITSAATAAASPTG